MRETEGQCRGISTCPAGRPVWAYLITCQAIRALIARTGAGHGLDPSRLTFTAALHAARAGAGSPAALQAAENAILAAVLRHP